MNQKRIKLLEKYIQEDSQNPFNQYALAMEYYDELPKKALSLLDRLLKRHPDYLPTYFKIAHLYWEMEQWSKADCIFRKGISLAGSQSDTKALAELKSTYQNFLMEKD